MTWSGPSVDIDNDGVRDIEWQEHQVRYCDGSTDYLIVKEYNPESNSSWINFGFPTIENGYSIKQQSLRMLLCLAQYSVDMNGSISVGFFDRKEGDISISNFEWHWNGMNSIEISADTKVLDFFTNDVVEGRMTLIYSKK